MTQFTSWLFFGENFFNCQFVRVFDIFVVEAKKVCKFGGVPGQFLGSHDIRVGGRRVPLTPRLIYLV